MLNSWWQKADVDFNITSLQAYARAIDVDDRAERIYRVLNLFNAVLLGFSQGYNRGRLVDPAIRKRVEYVRDHWTHEHYLHPLPHKTWNWDQVIKDLAETWMEPLDFKELRTNLKRRLQTAKQRGVDPRVTRPELLTFLQLLEDEMHRRNIAGRIRRTIV